MPKNIECAVAHLMGGIPVYERFGVKEYIIVYPEDELVERFFLEKDKYVAPEVINWDETMKIESLGLDVNLWDIFEKQREEKEEF